MSKFTPGPWMIDRTVALGVYGIWTDYATHPGHDGVGYGSQICSFDPMWPKEPKGANARLIAAAPDLLAALENVPIPRLTFDGNDNFVERFKEWYKNVRNVALDRAKGGNP